MVRNITFHTHVLLKEIYIYIYWSKKTWVAKRNIPSGTNSYRLKKICTRNVNKDLGAQID